MNIRRCLLQALLLTLAACGGTADPEAQKAEQIQQLQDSMKTALDDVRKLATLGPCSSTDQCAVLRFKSGRNDCDRPLPIDYSLGSTTAKPAQDAAANYDRYRIELDTLSPPPEIYGSCFINVLPLVLKCVANSCVRALS